MTCQRCQDEASVHLTETVDGQRREVHLCRACARKAGLRARPRRRPALALDAVVQGLIVAHVGELVGELAELDLPRLRHEVHGVPGAGPAGLPARLRASSRRGLLPLLSRVHGATRHVGKAARPRPGAAERLRLRTRLREAVAREDYEEAARLRDLLRHKEADG